MKKIRIWHVLDLVGYLFALPASSMLMNWLPYKYKNKDITFTITKVED